MPSTSTGDMRSLLPPVAARLDLLILDLLGSILRILIDLSLNFSRFIFNSDSLFKMFEVGRLLDFESSLFL